MADQLSILNLLKKYSRIFTLIIGLVLYRPLYAENGPF